MQLRCGDTVQISLWLVSIKRFLKRSSAWLKKNWQLVVGFCFASTLFILAKGKFDISAYLKKIRDGYDREIDAIERSHSREIERRDKALKDRDNRISDTEKDFDKNIIDLEKRKKERADDLLEDEDSNEKITERLSDITGIDIHD